MLLNRLTRKFEEKRRKIEWEVKEAERKEWEAREEKRRMIKELENGGVERKVKELVGCFIKGENIYKRTFRMNEHKMGILFNFDDVSYVYPFGRNYWGGALGVLLKKENGEIQYRVVALEKTISSRRYGRSTHTSSYWDVENQERYDVYKQIPDLFSQNELEILWNTITPLVPEYDDF